LDRNPEIAAKYHCDKHMKMVLESAQLLCTAHKCFGLNAPYRQTHVNHPCAKWVRESLENYKWLQKLAVHLCHEYTKRYGRIHKCQAVIEWAGENFPPLPPGNLTEFAQAMPEQYRGSDAVEAYRKYYIGDKSRFAKWKMGNIPEWYRRE
jgi:hypothetical protein